MATRVLAARDGCAMPCVALVMILRHTAASLSCSLLTLLCNLQYAKLQRSAAELADPDSRFAQICGTSVHYKAMRPAGRAQARRSSPSKNSGDPAAAIALLHGFGANTWSWAGVQQRLADRSSALVTAHCMPGFGLTERCRSVQAYSLCTNGNIGRQLQLLELAGPARRAGTEPPPLPRSGVKRVLVGHSLGCAGIATSFCEDAQGIDGIILVAPAIMANPFERVDLDTRAVRCAAQPRCCRLCRLH